MMCDRKFRMIMTAAAVAVVLAALPPGLARAQVYDSTTGQEVIDPATVPKFVTPMVIPPAMPRTGKIKVRGSKNADYYEIAQRQFLQQILPTGYGATTVWSYGSVQFPGTVAEGGSFNYPAFTIESKWQKPARVKWINEMVVDPIDCFHTPGGPTMADSCNYLPHLLPVDQTLHWANPAKGTLCKKTGLEGTDCRTNDPSFYTGPVPMIVHVHGAETYEWSDGYPEAWYLPGADDLGGAYATGGSFFDTFDTEAVDFFANDKKNNPDGTWGDGSATFQYPNDQEATTLWYHDHSLGMTRLNVYAGPAGFYLLRGGPGDAVIGTLPGPAPALGDPPGVDYYEIPIVIQDRSFYTDGSLAYPDNRAFFEDLDPGQLQIPFTPEDSISGEPSDVAPIWLPEFFGNTLVTNGNTWPKLEVEQRRYRFRMLNGSQSRFLILQFDDPNVEVWQIGAEQGFLPAPLDINSVSTNGVEGGILLGPAERADLIVDFTNADVGTQIILRNFGPDEPFGGGDVDDEDGFPAPNPDTTGQVMRFDVVAPKGADLSTPPALLGLPAPPVLGSENAKRRISLNELESHTVCVTEEDGNVVEAPCADDFDPFGPTEARLGDVDASGYGVPRGWAEETTENVAAAGNTEVWEIYNYTADAHPIHIHLIQFQVVNREGLETDEDGNAVAEPNGDVRDPEDWETGFKDTVISYPGEVTRVKAIFPLGGLFVWHCHILEHEDNEMMRPYCVADADGNFSAACNQHNGIE